MSLRDFLNKQHKHFDSGGKLERFEPIYEMIVSFLYPIYSDTSPKTHIRDPLELKRMMVTVVYALIPCMIMALYNTGLQANSAAEAFISNQMSLPDSWHTAFLSSLNFKFNSHSIISNLIHGAVYFLPIYAVTVIVGGCWEVLFALVRKHNINESFFVTSAIFPLILPATTPLWQVALAISFGIVFGKEIFGGTGRNIVNPAIFSRAFLFFAYPSSVTGQAIWYPISTQTLSDMSISVDAGSGATPLAVLKSGGDLAISWLDAFLGFIPGSMGETSAFACLIGALILFVSGIGSIRIMLSTVAGLAFIVFLTNIFAPANHPLYSLGLHWHLVLGGFAFGAVFMATDPVTASFTAPGKLIYGFIIGLLTGLVRFFSPAYPEGVMLAIIFANIVIPVIDYIFIKRNIKRREVRCA